MEIIADPSFSARNSELNNLRKTKQHIDFRLKNNSGESIGVHKVILVASCFALKGLLESQPDVNEFNLYIDISLDNLEKLVEYLYTGRVALTLKNAEILYESSLKLLLSYNLGLQKIIIDYMIRKIDLNFFLEFWRFAVKNQIGRLQANCTEFFISNFEKCFDTEITRLKEAELKKIISEGRSKIDPEILYLKIAVWIKKDIPMRKYLLNNLIENIDFSVVKLEFITSTMKEDILCFSYDPFSKKVIDLICFRKEIVNINHEDIYLVTSSEISKLDLHNKKTLAIYKINSVANPNNAIVATSSNEMLLTGGCNHKRETINSSKTISPFSNRIKELEPMKEARSCHCMCLINNKIYACGGFPSYSKCESFNLQTEHWITQPTFNQGRKSFGLIGTENCLYAIGGGFENKSINSIERLDLRVKYWEIIAESKSLGWEQKSLQLNNRIYGVDQFGKGSIFDIRMNKISGSISPVAFFGTGNKWKRFDITEYNSSIYGIFPFDGYNIYKYEYQHDKWVDLHIWPDPNAHTIDLVVMSESQ